MALAFALVSAPSPVAAQIQSPSQASEDDTAQSDVDPTRPVFFSIRPEFYTLAHGAEQRVLVFRTDAAVLKTQRFFSGLPGVILRFEAPVVGSDANGQHAFGVGDAYGQFLVIPYVNATKTFAWLFGTGVVLPTGTDMLTGGGKWVVAPMGIPLWRFANSLFYIKVQNFTSVAGDAARPDLNYLLVSPLFFRKMAAGWWVVADSDIKTIWTDDGRTNVRTGFLLGHGLVPGVSIWVKPEIWWGPNPDIRRAVRFGIVWYTRRAAPPAGATP